MADKFIIYCDGSCVPNPGVGGWGYLIYHDDNPNDIFSNSGSVNEITTNNRMELLAAIKAFDSIPHGYAIDIHLDSQYVINGITGKHRTMKNLDLWKLLRLTVKNHNTIKWNWVKAHHTNQHNNFVDELANNAAKNARLIK